MDARALSRAIPVHGQLRRRRASDRRRLAERGARRQPDLVRWPNAEMQNTIRPRSLYSSAKQHPATMPTTTVSSRSQIVFPAEIRRALGIRAGDRLDVSLEGDRIVLHRAPNSDTEALAELGGDHWSGHADELAEARDAWDRWSRRSPPASPRTTGACARGRMNSRSGRSGRPRMDSPERHRSAA